MNETGNNNKHKGEKAQKFVIAALAHFDVEVALPMSDNLPFDFIAIYKNRLYKVQVKSSSKNPNKQGNVQESICFNCSSSNWWRLTTKKYVTGDADVLIGYDWTDGGIYLLLPEQFVNRRSFSVRKVPSKNGQTKGCNLAQDFILSENRIEEVFVERG